MPSATVICPLSFTPPVPTSNITVASAATFNVRLYSLPLPMILPLLLISTVSPSLYWDKSMTGLASSPPLLLPPPSWSCHIFFHQCPQPPATCLPAPDILASFERVSSIMSAVCCLLSAVCCLLSAVCEGLYRDKFICQRIFFCGKHTFFAPEYIFSPTDNFVAARRCHQPGKTTKSNFK